MLFSKKFPFRSSFEWFKRSYRVTPSELGEPSVVVLGTLTWKQDGSSRIVEELVTQTCIFLYRFQLGTKLPMSFDFPLDALFALNMLPKNVSLRNHNDVVAVGIVVLIDLAQMFGGQKFFLILDLRMANDKTLVMKLILDGDDVELWEILFQGFSKGYK